MAKRIDFHYEILHVVANADPNLVMKVRTMSGGKDRKTQITPGRLKPVVFAFPGEENFDTQNNIINQIVERRLTAAESDWFVKQIARKVSSGIKIDDVDFEKIATKMPSLRTRQIPKNIDEPDEEDLAAIEEDIEFESEGQANNQNWLGKGAMTTSDHTEWPDPKDIFGNDPPSLEGSTWDEPTEDQLGFKSDRSIPNLGFAGSGMSRGKGHRGITALATSEDLAKLRTEISSLRQALKKAHIELTSKNGNVDDSWFETAHYLSEDERKIMNLLFKECLDIDTIASSIHETRLRIIQIAQSAFIKRYLEKSSEGKTA